MIGDTREHEPQVRFRIDVVEFGGTHEAINCGRAFAARIGAGEEIVPPSDSDAAQGAFDRQVIYFKATVIAVPRERLPPIERVENRPARVGLLRERLQCRCEPDVELIQQRPRVLLTIGSSLPGRLAADDLFDLVKRTDAFERFGIERVGTRGVQFVKLSSRVRLIWCTR